MKPGQTLLSVEQRLETLTQIIIRARIYYDFWWFLEGQESLPNIIDTLNDFPDFFRFARHSYFVSMIVHSAVVWDKGRGKISLEQIASAVLDCQRYPAHKEIASNIAQLKEEAKGLVAIRHGAIAHRSSTESYAKVFERAGVISNTIPSMLLKCLEIANQLREQRSLVTADFLDTPLQNLQTLVHRLGGPDLKPKSSLDEILQP